VIDFSASEYSDVNYQEFNKNSIKPEEENLCPKGQRFYGLAGFMS